MRLKKGERYAHLSVAYYEDEVLQAVADETGYALTVWAAWPYFVARAKRSWSDDNRAGRFGGSVRALARAIGTTVDELGPVINAFEEGGLIRLERGRLGTVQIELERFEKWQHASWDSERKMRAERAREQGKTSLSSEVLPEDFRVASTDKDKDKEEEKREKPDSGNPNRGPATAEINAVIEHFDTERAKRPGTRPLKWDAKRRRLVRGRLVDGFTVADLQQAATAMLASDWPWETGNANPEHVYRNTANVERYLERGTTTRTKSADDNVRWLV